MVLGYLGDEFTKTSRYKEEYCKGPQVVADPATGTQRTVASNMVSRGLGVHVVLQCSVTVAHHGMP